MDVNHLIEIVKREQKRTDKMFQALSLERRGDEVVVFFNYEETVDNELDDPHFIQHHHDPVFLTGSDLDKLINELNQIGTAYELRDDVFM
ncbi:hypothetical protein [Staphylococcus auricularis]|uniref:Uncharacterized protein n=1 Tax=Staphylococcus auricularis TaxID=29379 RepID=A0ABX5IDV8_9STAP|nr:hypothetical protein [Staphylococcus auricularis]MCE5037763.1 hypothetical protein [Staphylococcus auricularis]MEB6569716.1 hypothetical protein [Staphylococcus auricularis]PTH13516.1 hypothetical protein BU607_09690 [Staphylococcus auricularis]PTH26025.1 hypothetical protein BU608_05500 [Staphylococcus auricularis]